MNKTNEIVICKNKFESNEDFENAIKEAVTVLLNNDYIMTVRYDEKSLGIVVIEYSYAERKLGAAYPYWLSPEELESVEWEDN